MLKEIPLELIQLEQIYAEIRRKQVKSVAITAANAKEGCSSLALALAKRSALNGKKTLLVDFNMVTTAITAHFKMKPHENKDFETVVLSNIQATETEHLSVLAAHIHLPLILQLRDPDNLEHCFNSWSQHFDFIVVDCSPLLSKKSQVIAADLVCASAQGAIFLILAGKTVEAHVQAAIGLLENSGANVLGIVLNDQYNPKLSEQLCHTTQRLSKLFPRMMQKLRRRINNTPILTLDI